MTKSEIIRFLLLQTIGNFLVLFALFGVVATFGPDLYYEIKYQIMQVRGVHYLVVNPVTKLPNLANKQSVANTLSSGFGAVLSGPREQLLIPKDTMFDVLIPKIGANAKVFPNVDPTNPNIYLPILKQGVAHAQGSVFPGMKGTTYLFAHSTDNFWDVGRYNAVFYLLKDLSVGDSIVVFYQNQRFDYAVKASKIIDANDVSYLAQSQNTTSQLILQTCWPPGTDWKRLLIIAEPISAI